MKVLGFVLNFGYVESARVGRVFLYHMRHARQGTGFESIQDGLKDLALYLLEDYLDGNRQPTIDGYQQYLCGLPSCDASANKPFCQYHWNQERWWPWETVTRMVPLFDEFYENGIDDPMEAILPHFLEPAKVQELLSKKKSEAAVAAAAVFVEELKKFQEMPDDEDDIRTREELLSCKNFTCLKPPEVK